jgi:hypothetical protein
MYAYDHDKTNYVHSSITNGCVYQVILRTKVLNAFRAKRRGQRVNGGHLREMQDKLETTSEVENLHKWALSLKGALLKYAV